MKTTLLYGLFMVLSVSIFTSCSKDIGNYDYHDINQITFTDFQTTAGYRAIYGEVLTINPTLSMSQDQNFNEANYAYEWSLRLGSSSAPPLRDSVISTDKVLNVEIGLSPGAYSLQYKVTDKNTTVQFQKRTTLTVTTDVYEGYLVLSDVNGSSRLDMLSYSNNTFTQYTDVLQRMGSTVPHSGTPYEVLCMQYTTATVAAQNYGIFLLTSDGTNRINQETFGWDPTYNIRYLMIGQVPETFIAQGLVGSLTNGTYPTMYMYAGDNIYSYSTLAGYAFRYTPLNVYTVSGTPFKTTPYIATDGSITVFYDADSRKFVTTASTSATVASAINPTFNYPAGYDLIWMNCNYYPEGGQLKTTYAILKDPVTAKYYMLHFELGFGWDPTFGDYFQELTGTDIAAADNFTVSPDFGHLFYSVGGKVYEYDLSLKKSFLMLDKGSSQITFLSFLHFYNRYGKPNYVNWSKQLTVGYYDPSGTPGTNGVLEQYSVPPVNGQIVQTNRWTGFGKIVSVAYRTR